MFTGITVIADDNYTLNAGISINEVPETFFGSWRVTAKLDDTDSPRTFKPQSIDVWSLERVGDTISLVNYFSGAHAKISIKATEGNLIVFSKEAPYENKILTDTVSIRLEKNSFSGINTLFLKSYSPVDGKLTKTESARYLLNGEKISGDNVL